MKLEEAFVGEPVTRKQMGPRTRNATSLSAGGEIGGGAAVAIVTMCSCNKSRKVNKTQLVIDQSAGDQSIDRRSAGLKSGSDLTSRSPVPVPSLT